jgi:hypothetical protein
VTLDTLRNATPAGEYDPGAAAEGDYGDLSCENQFYVIEFKSFNKIVNGC